MEPQIVIIALVVVLIVLGVILWYKKYSAKRRTVVLALIDIYNTGHHHVAFIPEEDIHPVDLVQLVISYAANVIMLTTPYEINLMGGFHQLLLLNRKHYDLANEVEYRQELTTLVTTPQQSLLSSGKLSTDNVDRYQVRLIRGKKNDYSLTDFSAYSYKPNLANSALYLYHAVVTRLDSTNLKLLHASLAALDTYFHDTRPTVINNQAIAFAAVEYVLSIFPESVENSPGRISRKA